MPSLSAKMLWLLLMVMPLGGANTSDQRVSTVAPPHRISHQQQRLHQLEAAQQHQQKRHHHLRHEQHLRAELEGNGNHQPPPPMGGSEGDRTAFEKTFESQLPMQQHHLRHHNHHHKSWEQRVFPALRHQTHRMAFLGTSTPRTVFTTDSPTTSHRGLIMNHTRYFDRDGMNPPWAEYHTTRGPNWRQELDTSNSDEESDEEDDDEDEDEYDYNDESSSNAVDEELARQMPRYSLFTEKLRRTIENKETEYDQSDELELAENRNRNRNSNRHPSVANPHDKPAEKRHIFDWLFKQDREKDVTKKPHTTATPKTTTTTTTSTTTQRPEKQELTLLDANLQDKNDLNEDDFNEDSDSESEEAFSNEQWNKIQHDHHLQQQKHQKELQALREKNRNTPLIRNGAPPSHYNTESEEIKNTISHNYLPGGSTRRKIDIGGEGHSKKRFSEANKLAQDNVKRVAREAACRIPQKRCLLVQQDTSKEYWPRCAILHRCSEDSGCCRKGKICAAKSTHNVELYFFVYDIKEPRTIEKRTFVNHTECHCIERSNYNEETAMTVVRASVLSCTCPSAFEKILQDDDQCRCDCTSSNAGCDSLKRGKEHFSLNDRKCIEQGRCKLPTCEYGPFIKKQGRCPKHNELAYSVMS